MRFEIMRLDDSGTSPAASGPEGGTTAGSTEATTVVDAATVTRIVQQAAATGQRLYIRPADSPAAS